MQKTILAIIGVIVIGAGAWYFISHTTPSGNGLLGKEDLVATVNGEEILRDDFEALKSQVVAGQGIDIASLDAEAQSQFDTQVVNELVSRTLLQQAVKTSGAVVSEENINTQINATIVRLGGDEAFREALVSEGLSEEAFRVQVSAELATQAYLEQELDLSSVTATNEEVEALYAQAASQDESVPPLEDVRPQVEQSVIQQKQQSLVSQLIENLRTEADIKIFL